jgi:protocatechuate 3,4-dioxygenase, beta subunit
MTFVYPRESAEEGYGPRLYPRYKSTIKRAPEKPLVIMPLTLSELTGPVYGHEKVREQDSDLAVQHTSEPIGERIIVHATCSTRMVAVLRVPWSNSGRLTPAAATFT